MDIYGFLEACEPSMYVGVDALTYTGKTPLSMVGARAIVDSLSPDVEM